MVRHAVATGNWLLLPRLHHLPRRIGHAPPDQAKHTRARQHLAAVHVHHLTVDVACLIADEERAQVTNLLQRPKAMQRIMLQQLLLYLRRRQQTRESAFGTDRARSDSDTAHTAPAPLHGEAAHERDDARL